MRKFIPLIAAASLLAGIAPAQVQAKGCLRGAVAGGVAGHYAGHHAVVGAMGGCIAAHEYYKHKANVAKAQAAQQQHATETALHH